jgi:hypothetical protein
MYTPATTELVSKLVVTIIDNRTLFACYLAWLKIVLTCAALLFMLLNVYVSDNY